MAAKMRPKRARTQRYTAAPRGTVRGKPAHATGAFPTLAPALARRRPRDVGTSKTAQPTAVATAPRNDVPELAPRGRAREKAATYEE